MARERDQKVSPLLSPLTNTGLVDAVSYIALGHVFTANMTGKIVFLGFASAGTPGLSVVRSLTALAGLPRGHPDDIGRRFAKQPP
jgi:uncharacterized membrane protein YoaK (UPF0700 family)